jgi:hypothetical protein
MVTFGSVKEKAFDLLETGEYVLTLNDLDESMGQYGQRLVWKFLIAPVSDPINYINKRKDGSGDAKDIWAFTNTDIVIGSLQHEFVEKLTGRTFDKNSEPPTEDDLLGRRIIAYISHYIPKTGKNAGNKQEQIVAGSVKPFKGPQPNKVILSPTSDELPADNQDRAVLVKRFEKLVGKAVMLETTYHKDYIALDIEATDDASLAALIDQVDAEVKAAVAA